MGMGVALLACRPAAVATPLPGQARRSTQMNGTQKHGCRVWMGWSARRLSGSRSLAGTAWQGLFGQWPSGSLAMTVGQSLSGRDCLAMTVWHGQSGSLAMTVRQLLSGGDCLAMTVWHGQSGRDSLARQGKSGEHYLGGQGPAPATFLSARTLTLLRERTSDIAHGPSSWSGMSGYVSNFQCCE